MSVLLKGLCYDRDICLLENYSIMLTISLYPLGLGSGNSGIFIIFKTGINTFKSFIVIALTCHSNSNTLNIS